MAVVSRYFETIHVLGLGASSVKLGLLSESEDTLPCLSIRFQPFTVPSGSIEEAILTSINGDGDGVGINHVLERLPCFLSSAPSNVDVV